MTAYEYYGTFFEELATQGVRHVVCSPGSRSAPLILSAHAERRLQCWVQIDERAGGFFALGLAKERRECVALICTSGSAATNYLPALTEAFYDGVALIVLTADRPPELRDRGAGQTIDQIRLYGGHVRWSADLPVPGEVSSDHARYVARRAGAAAAGPPAGPVHLNVPLREPLEPPAGDTTAAVDASPGGHFTRPQPAASPDEVATLAHLVCSHERGLLAIGPSDLDPADAAALKQLAALAGWPLIADAASGLRRGAAAGATIVATGHHLAGAASFWERHRPEVIIRSGHPTAGRALREGLAGWGSQTWLVDPLDRWPEPTTVPAGQWRSPIGALARGVLTSLGAARNDPAPATGDTEPAPPAGLADRRGSAWVVAWRDADAGAQRAITATLQAGPFLEAGVARALGEVLGPDTTLYASNSMPVRDLDAFLAPHRRAPRVVAHRGTNGIDGVVSAAAGCAATATPVVLLAGDLALLHDIGGLLGAVRLGVDLTIVVPNNDGGGIFSFLPVAEAVPRHVFERFFVTPHGTDLATVLAGLGIRHHLVSDAVALREVLGTTVAAGGIDVLEIPVDTEANVAQHRLVETSVRGALASSDRSERPER